MALYQAMRATPDRLPTERPKWKEEDEELTEEEVPMHGSEMHVFHGGPMVNRSL